MKMQRRTEEQIIAVMKEQEAGAKAADLCRKHDFLQLESQVWRHGDLREKRLKALEEKNAKLKKLLAEEMLDVTVFRELLSKNVWSAPSVQGFATSRMTIPVA